MPAAKAALEFGALLIDQFTAEDLEVMEAGEVGRCSLTPG